MRALAAGAGLLAYALFAALLLWLYSPEGDDLPIALTPWSMIVAFTVASLTGLIFGLYPAMKASKQDPIVALRHD